MFRTYANKPGFDSKSLFLTDKYLRETGFAEFAWVSSDVIKNESDRIIGKFFSEYGTDNGLKF